MTTGCSLWLKICADCSDCSVTACHGDLYRFAYQSEAVSLCLGGLHLESCTQKATADLPASVCSPDDARLTLPWVPINPLKLADHFAELVRP